MSFVEDENDDADDLMILVEEENELLSFFGSNSFLKRLWLNENYLQSN